MTPSYSEGTSVCSPIPDAPERIVHPDLAGRVAAVLPRRKDMTPAELVQLADSLIGVGMRLAGIIHDEDPAHAARLLDALTPDRQWALPFVMAAMVDVERSARELLEWAPFQTPGGLLGATSVAPAEVLLRATTKPSRVKECGTDAAWRRHKYHGEEPCDIDWIAHRAWENDKKKAQRQRRNEASVKAARQVTVIDAALEAVKALRATQPDLFSTLEPEETFDAA